MIRGAFVVLLSTSPILACIGGLGSAGGCCAPSAPSCGPAVPHCSSSSYPRPSGYALTPPPPPLPQPAGYAVSAGGAYASPPVVSVAQFSPPVASQQPLAVSAPVIGSYPAALLQVPAPGAYPSPIPVPSPSSYPAPIPAPAPVSNYPSAPVPAPAVAAPVIAPAPLTAPVYVAAPAPVETAPVVAPAPVAANTYPQAAPAVAVETVHVVVPAPSPSGYVAPVETQEIHHTEVVAPAHPTQTEVPVASYKEQPAAVEQHVETAVVSEKSEYKEHPAAGAYPTF